MLAAANLVISEFMATNVTTYPDFSAEYPDWIEIHNLGATTVDLSDYSLTDNASVLQKWNFPATTIAPGGYEIVFASAPLDANGDEIDNYVDPLGFAHANFKLNSGGEYLALTYEDPFTQAVSVVHEYAPEFPEQYPDYSYGIASGGLEAYFDAPTPGTANGVGLLGVVADTQFSVDRGFYDTPFQVDITTATSGANIYYTTDGSAPSDTNGTLYTGSLTVDQTTVLRAIAVKADHVPTNVDTQTYLFLDDIVNQTESCVRAQGYPDVWFAENGAYTADYGFDPDVIGTFDGNGNPLGGDLYGGTYAAELQDSLLSIPTISVVLDPDDMFENGPQSDRGIYIDPRKGRNLEPERETSIEWITPDDSAELQVDAGIQIQGGAFRSHFLTLKHSFRLVFKDEYGPSELEFPLFGEGATDQFNTVVLKATANDGYSWRSSQPSDGPATLQYTRDQFGHSLQQDMGHASPHHAYAHLYINGIYWGVYYAQERPDSEFAASYLGTNPEKWDGVNSPDDDDDPPEANTGDLVAWNAMLSKTVQAGSSLTDYMELRGLNLDGTPDPATAALLDVENYIDYLLINVWGGNDDWPHHNWWAGRDRDPNTTEGFQFFLWDYDGVMHVNESWSPLDTWTFNQDFTSPVGNNVGEPHHNLQTNPEYQLAFADRVQKYFFNDGLLTSDSLLSRYQEIANRVEEVIVAESARWGDMNSPTETPIVLSDWQAERDYLLGTYLPQRSDVVMQELLFYGLYPDVAAPTVNQFGGEVASGFDAVLTNPGSGTIYYTTDGSDPRLPGGAINSGSVTSGTGPLSIDITSTTHIRARVLDGGDWSAEIDTTFTVEELNQDALRIVELMYNPAGSVDPEYIELLNTGTQPIDLAGVQITDFSTGGYTFSSHILAAGERIVVPENLTDFQARYPTVTNVTSTAYSGSLGNGGDTVTLRNTYGEVLQSFTYDDEAGWPTTPDNGGPSLEYVGPLHAGEDPLDGAPDDPFDEPANWQASAQNGGSPGESSTPTEDPDFDDDTLVTGLDFLIWQSNAGLTSGANNSDGDSDADGDVDVDDLANWEALYGQSVPIPALLAAFSSEPLAVAIPLQEVQTQPTTKISEAPGNEPALSLTSMDPAQAEKLLSNMPTRRRPLSVQEHAFEAISLERPTADNYRLWTAEEDISSISIPRSTSSQTTDDVTWLAEELLENVFG